MVLQGPDHLEPGAIADVSEAGIAVTAEVALQDPAVLGPVEKRPPALQFQHAFGCLLRVELGHPPVVQHLAAAHGVAEVHLPVVLGPHVAESRRDTPLGHDRVRLAEERLADEAHRDSLGGRLDGRAQTGPPCPDDDDVVLVGLVVELCHHRILTSWMTPMETSRM